jgi:ATP-binding cassette subfamily B protein
MKVYENSIAKLAIEFWSHISRHRRRQCLLMFFLMLITSLSEVISIGAILPFLGVLVSPETVLNYSPVKSTAELFGYTNTQELLLPLTIFFISAITVAGLMRILLLWLSSIFSFKLGSDISSDIYRRTLYQTYSIHCSRNSSEIIDGVYNKTSRAIYTINMFLTLSSAIITLVAILLTMIFINPKIALLAFGSFGLIYFLISRITRKEIAINGKCIAKESKNIIKSLQEGLGGIRDIIIDGNHAIYCEIFGKSDKILRRAEGYNLFIGSSPRYVVETLGMVVMITIAYRFSLVTDGVSSVIPVLGLFALGAQKLLPVLQQAYAAWTQIVGGKTSFEETLTLLKQPLPADISEPLPNAMPFKQYFELIDVSFRYEQRQPNVLDSINLKINKGDCIGFIGETGSGKSTLIDLIMCLLEPSQGGLFIDGQ